MEEKEKKSISLEIEKFQKTLKGVQSQAIIEKKLLEKLVEFKDSFHEKNLDPSAIWEREEIYEYGDEFIIYAMNRIKDRISLINDKVERLEYRIEILENKLKLESK